MSALRSVWGFLRTRKKFWLAPMLSVLLIFAILMLIGQGDAGVFVYTLF